MVNFRSIVSAVAVLAAAASTVEAGSPMHHAHARALVADKNVSGRAVVDERDVNVGVGVSVGLGGLPKCDPKDLLDIKAHVSILGINIDLGVAIGLNGKPLCHLPKPPAPSCPPGPSSAPPHPPSSTSKPVLVPVSTSKPAVPSPSSKPPAPNSSKPPCSSSKPAAPSSSSKPAVPSPSSKPAAPSSTSKAPCTTGKPGSPSSSSKPAVPAPTTSAVTNPGPCPTCSQCGGKDGIEIQAWVQAFNEEIGVQIDLLDGHNDPKPILISIIAILKKHCAKFATIKVGLSISICGDLLHFIAKIICKIIAKLNLYSMIQLAVCIKMNLLHELDLACHGLLLQINGNLSGGAHFIGGLLVNLGLFLKFGMSLTLGVCGRS